MAEERGIKRKKRAVIKCRFDLKKGRDYRPAQEQNEARISGLQLSVDKLAVMLRECTDTIIDIGDVLNKSQPPMKGKIEVRYWKVAGLVNPVVVLWGDGEMTVLKSEDIARHQNRRGGFERNKVETGHLLRVLAEQMRFREQLIKLMGDFKRTVTLIDGKGYRGLKVYRRTKVLDEIERMVNENNLAANTVILE